MNKPNPWLTDGNLVYRLKEDGFNEVSISIQHYRRDKKFELKLAKEIVHLLARASEVK